MKNVAKKAVKGGKPGARTLEKNILGKSGSTYKCQICNKESKNAIDAMTHLIDHGTSALEAVNSFIKAQKSGKVSDSDRLKEESARASTEEEEK